MLTYREFLEQSYDIPKQFLVRDGELHFHGINMMELIETYKTPLRFTYLPVISQKIVTARRWFEDSMARQSYDAKYHYCYCTKSSHFEHVMGEVLSAGAQLETSSAMDIPIIDALERSGRLSKDHLILCNGFKDDEYKRYIVDLIHDGFTNVIPILDGQDELGFYEAELRAPCTVGLRLATEEPPESHFYTNRLGIREDQILDFYSARLAGRPLFRLKLLHFFVHSGIQDRPGFWSELRRLVLLYAKLKKLEPGLDMLDIGGGFPFCNALDFEYDYAYIVDEIVRTVKEICDEEKVAVPDLLTEFGSYTVAESSGTLFKVLGRKQQNDREKWFMVDGSIISMLPDVWALNRRFLLMPVNNWGAGYEKVAIGGMTCDNDDFYGEVQHKSAIFMPKTLKQQYVGFFHTGAYQEVLSGVGGLHHCLMPDPKHVVISVDDAGERHFRVLHEEQNSRQALRILGYRSGERAEASFPAAKAEALRSEETK